MMDSLSGHDYSIHTTDSPVHGLRCYAYLVLDILLLLDHIASSPV